MVLDLKIAPSGQTIVKTTAFDLQLNPANPGMSFHKLQQGQGQELLVGAG